MSRDEDAADKGFAQFERFLDEWSRRDFLRRAGGTTAFLAFSGGIVGFLEACAGTSSNNSTSGTAKKGGHVVEGNFTDIRTLNSMLSSDPASNIFIGLMFDGLTNQKKDGTIIPALAESWKSSSDGLTYTFKLRSGLKWSDGQPITSDDVKFTYALAYEPA